MPTRGDISIWLVDDDPAFRETMEAGLGLECDFDIRAFESADSALSALRSTMKKPELVLLDIRMPGRSGLMAIEEFRRVSAKTKILMLTMSGARVDVDASMKAGAFSYVQKTAGLSETILAIRNALVNRRHVDDSSLTVLLDALYRGDDGKARYALSERENQVLTHLAEGQSRKAIADRLGVSEQTVKSYLKSIYTKLGVQKNSEAVRKAMEERLL